jgi:hypothetical protein
VIDDARITRMYPSMAPSQATPESAAHVSPHAAQSDTPATADVPQRDAGGFKPSHPHDIAARRYPNQEQPDSVAQAIADAVTAARGEQQEWVENVPETVKALRESEPAGSRREAMYDQALGIRTKDLLSGQLSPEHALVRNAVSGMAHDAGIAPDDLAIIVNDIRAGLHGVKADGQASDLDMADAATLYARDPRIGALVNHFNIGSHPRVVAILAAAARQQRAAGRL